MPLSLDEVDPIFADAVQVVFEAQIDIFHTVIRTLQVLSLEFYQRFFTADKSFMVC